MSDRTHGTLKRWFADRGFGFFASDHDGDIFVSRAAFDHAGITAPAVGECYSFEITHDRDRRARASDIEHAASATAARQIFSPVRP